MNQRFNITFLKSEIPRMEQLIIASKEANELIESYYKSVIQSNDKNTIGQYQMMMAIKYFYLGEYKKADQFLKKVRAAKLKDELLNHKVNYWNCALNYINGRREEILFSMQETLNYFAQIDLKQYQYLCMSLQSSMFLEIGFLEEALLLQIQCSEYYLKIDHFGKYLVAQIQISNIYYTLNQFEDAERILSKTIAQNEVKFNSIPIISQANFWKNYGDIFLAWKKSKDAFNCYQKILNFNIDQLHPYFQGSFYISYSQAFLLKKNYTEALKLSLLALEKARAIDSSKQQLICHQNIAELYLKLNLFKKANNHLKEALKISKTSNFGILTAGIHEAFYLMFKLQKEYEKAQQHLEMVIKIKDEINAKESEIRINAIRALNGLKEKESQLEYANREIELQKQELELTTLYLNQKNAMLSELEAFIISLRKEGINKQALFEVIQNKIKKAKKNNTENAGLNEKLSKTNQDFSEKLRNLYPSITKSESQIAVFLTKGFSTKEIADMLVIDIRSIEMHRYRLRKKMNLDRKTDLQLHLSNIFK